MIYEQIKKQAKDDMTKALDSFDKRIVNIKAGRATEAILDGMTFSYYGTETPINQAATVSIPEARLLVIKPWDKTNIGPIEKAILKSNIGITPQNDGEVIRLPFPQLTEERRKDLTKVVGKNSEAAKIAIRNIRRDAMDEIKKAEKSKEITEDDRKSNEEEIQKLTDKYIEEIDKITKAKEIELMEI